MALACHGFASAGAVTLGSALSPLIPLLGMLDGILPATGNIPNVPSVTAPALAKPWHASAMLPSPQPNAVAEEICGKKTFHRLKSFSPRDRIEALQLRPTNQKKLFSL